MSGNSELIFGLGVFFWHFLFQKQNMATPFLSRRAAVWRLLNLEASVTDGLVLVTDEDEEFEDITEKQEEELEECRKKIFKTIKDAADGARIEGLYVTEDMAIYVNEEGMLKPDLQQNESVAYLMAALVPGWVGLIYGAAAIECRTKETRERMKIWVARMREGLLENAETDKQFRDLWRLPLGDYGVKYPDCFK